ncbi:MAG: efflux RND transporter permease subunit, partial [Pseudomonadota bacterium]|nr:efflux RND transporter permease subunit [Pseudomonadota bacterium]
KYGIGIGYEGKLQEQADNLRDLATGALLGLAIIYIVLAWVFSSYSWPLAIMTAIFFGLTGAVIGHLFAAPFGIHFSMFSAMGLFGLSGIIVNDAIVLVSFYQQLVAEGMERFQAIVEACVRRLRAVLLTSITTVAGLTPMLFETSLQAQFLKPMAISIVFGLFFGTALILLVVPAMLMIIEEQRDHFRGMGQRLAPANWGQLARQVWRFDPVHYRQQPGPEGLGGHLWWVMILGPWLLLMVLGKLPLIVAAGQAGHLALAIPGGILWGLMAGLGAFFLWQLFRRRRQAPHSAARWLLAVVMGGLLMAIFAPLAGPEGNPLALAFWEQAKTTVWIALVLLPLLFWTRRSAHTLTR